MKAPPTVATTPSSAIRPAWRCASRCDWSLVGQKTGRALCACLETQVKLPLAEGIDR
jgi:hypothetical protein